MGLIKYCNKIIEYSFYALFILVPIVLSQYTSELFELNKMWITFTFSVVIGACWIIKMIVEKRILLRRTFFDIPILLFFISQLISSFFSLDPHISWWGYYSRFNGGFLSTICYILLYYAFLSNLSLKHLKNSLFLTLITGLFVTLWGIPAHFGKDPTCLVFRGTLDTSCWTEAFQPTVRIFSTLGQPAWMAAYLAFLIPLALAYFLNRSIFKSQKNSQFLTISYLVIAVIFYIGLIFANTRAGFLAFWIGNIAFWGALLIEPVFKKLTSFTSKTQLIKYALVINALFLLCNFLFGFPLSGFEKFTLANLTHSTSTPKVAIAPQAPTPAQGSAQNTTPAPTAGSSNITDSAAIRKIVWKGAIDAWKKSPVFGTGVETFAFAYYKSRPSEHNLTSEWDYLYNKAHNEYLNYLTTTGLFGLGSYLLLIVFIIYLAFLFLKEKNIESPENKKTILLAYAIFSGWLTLLVSNFFGFSVVIINIFFFMTPAFLLLLYSELKPDNKYLKNLLVDKSQKNIGGIQWTGIIIIILLTLYMLLTLLTYWNADKKYALGYNLNRVGEYQQAYTNLSEAVTLRPTEPVFKDELALNLATIATALSLQNGDPATASQAAQQAVILSNETTQNYPNNITFWKNRVKIFSLFTQSNLPDKQAFYNLELESLQKVSSLAPTDAKVLYSLGSLLRSLNTQDAILVLEETVRQKPDYTDAYRDLGNTYLQVANQTSDPIQKMTLLKKAKDALTKVVEQNPNDTQTKKTLKNLGV